MPSWNSRLYLQFAAERTWPARELAARLAVENPRRVIDLGCGAGNSTAVLAERWPEAELTGLDSSPEMLATARKDHPNWKWIEGDIASWKADAPFDVVFSNAALQWVGEHRTLYPHLLGQVAPGGALAVQVPANFDAPPHRLMRELGASPAWRGHFPSPPPEWHSEEPAFYYDVLAGKAARLDIWTTEYQQVMESVDAIVEWYQGTGLRPWLDALPSPAERNRFLADYRALLAPAFPPRSDGRVLFPFRRLFVVAYKG